EHQPVGVGGPIVVRYLIFELHEAGGSHGRERRTTSDRTQRERAHSECLEQRHRRSHRRSRLERPSWCSHGNGSVTLDWMRSTGRASKRSVMVENVTSSRNSLSRPFMLSMSAVTRDSSRSTWIASLTLVAFFKSSCRRSRTASAFFSRTCRSKY